MRIDELQAGLYYRGETTGAGRDRTIVYFKLKEVEGELVKTDGEFISKKNYRVDAASNIYPLDDFTNVNTHDECTQSWGDYDFLEITQEEFEEAFE